MATITITVKFNTYITEYAKINNGIAENKAWITADHPGEADDPISKTYRTEDYDYVTMLSYSTKIKKYVTRVMSKNSNGDDEWRNLNTNSNDPLYNGPVANRSNVDDGTKEANPVLVEWGDTVEFCIEVTNNINEKTNGENTTVRLTKLIDEFDASHLEYNGIEDGFSVIQNGGTVTIIGDKAIAPGESCYIHIYFKIKYVNANESTSFVKLKNEAKVIEIRNKYNNTNIFVAGEGYGNGNGFMYGYDNSKKLFVESENACLDWIKTKNYGVALNKYITGVKSTGKGSRDNTEYWLQDSKESSLYNTSLPAYSSLEHSREKDRAFPGYTDENDYNYVINGLTSGTLNITTIGQFRAFATYVNNNKNDCSGKIVNLLNDISLGDFEPIHSFNGTFDGNGHKIEYSMNKNQNAGLFSTLTGTVKNLEVSGTITASGNIKNIGIIAGNIVGGQIDKCYTEGKIETDGQVMNDSETLDNYNQNVGGIAGNASGNVKITNCINSVNITNANGKDILSVGGFLGKISDGQIEIDYCLNRGAITIGEVTLKPGENNSRYSKYYGGFIGYSAGNINLNYCTNSGSININNQKSTDIGGMIGGSTKTNNINNCVNTADLIGNRTIGGIIGISGWLENSEDQSIIQNCLNKGKIQTKENKPNDVSYFAGGIAGLINRGVIKNSQNKGEIGTYMGLYDEIKNGTKTIYTENCKGKDDSLMTNLANITLSGNESNFKMEKTTIISNLDNRSNKRNNPVRVEIGDSIEYTVDIAVDTSLYNETYKGSIYVEIIDTVTSGNIRLRYESCANARPIDENGNVINDNKKVASNQRFIIIDNGKEKLLEANRANPGFIRLKLYYKVEYVEGGKQYTNQEVDLTNTAEICKISNRNKIEVKDYYTYDNSEADYARTKVYSASLNKYISLVSNRGINNLIEGAGTEEKNIYDSNKNNSYNLSRTYNNGNYNNDYYGRDNNENKNKYNNPVRVNKGDSVTYTIEVKNTGKTENVNGALKMSEILDTITSGYGNDFSKWFDMSTIIIEGEYNGSKVTVGQEKQNKQIKLSDNNLLQPQTTLKQGETLKIYITGKIKVNNISLDILENKAEITQIKNRNNIEIKDTTQNDNVDKDYLQMKDITIAGNVWNDGTVENNKMEYNAEYDDGERKLNNIKVELYRGNKLVSVTYTKNDGSYQFTENMIGKWYKSDGSVNANYISLDDYEKHIKAPYSNVNRWNYGAYYNYYVVFEYDGIRYTSSTNGTDYKVVNKNESDYEKNSNAREKTRSSDSFDGKVYKDRTTFNNWYETINNTTTIKNTTTMRNEKIQYDTVNEAGNKPQSIYKSIYNPDVENEQERTNAMQASTNNIALEDDTLNNDSAEYEKRLNNIGLALRGKDSFDLTLKSDISKVTTMVNNKVGVYNYTSDINIRNSDQKHNVEDMAHPKPDLSPSEGYKTTRIGENVGQVFRKTDADVGTRNNTTGTTNESYTYNQGIQKIETTYEITITNETKTEGMPTQITDYFDKAYAKKVVGLTAEVNVTQPNGEVTNEEIKISSRDIISEENYNKVVLYIDKDDLKNKNKGHYLTEKQSINIEITFEMTTDAINELRGSIGASTANFYKVKNLVEISEYTTQTAAEQNIHTKGILDIDSAPGSVTEEKARLIETGESNETTIDYYYYNKQHTENERNNDLKVEDDTDVSPTFYFTSQENKNRTLEGIVFRDNTEIKDGYIKTGNGIKDNGEAIVSGATVELIEKVGNKWKMRYTTTTNSNGNYRFTNFLPGDYIVRYHYGDTEKTVLMQQDGAVNEYSYNGEDYQSTNNTGEYGAYELNKTPQNYWYVYNEEEGISTATDNEDRRKEVTINVTKYSDKSLNGDEGEDYEKIKELNLIRDGETDKSKLKYLNGIIEDTKMNADTDSFTLTVEKSVKDDNEHVVQNTSYEAYNVGNMNFGIAEMPYSTIDLQKHVKSFRITDSAGNNELAAAERNENEIYLHKKEGREPSENRKAYIEAIKEKIGNVEFDATGKIEINNNIVDEIKGLITKYSVGDLVEIQYGWTNKKGATMAEVGIKEIVSEIDNAKLQGAKLQITYEISETINIQRDFRNKTAVVPTITGIVDYIDNDLTYNSELYNEGANKKNSELWEVKTYKELQKEYNATSFYMKAKAGAIDSEGTNNTVAVVATNGNPLLALKTNGTVKTEITLEKVLSSIDSSLEGTLGSKVDVYEYDNTIEILKINYNNGIPEPNPNQEYTFIRNDPNPTPPEPGTSGNEFVPNIDKVRTIDRFTILPGIDHDYSEAETVSIIPPTGKNNSMMYYVIAGIGLLVLIGGTILIKKKVLTNKNK